MKSINKWIHYSRSKNCSQVKHPMSINTHIPAATSAEPDQYNNMERPHYCGSPVRNSCVLIRSHIYIIVFPSDVKNSSRHRRIFLSSLVGFILSSFDFRNPSGTQKDCKTNRSCNPPIQFFISNMLRLCIFIISLFLLRSHRTPSKVLDQTRTWRICYCGPGSPPILCSWLTGTGWGGHVTS